MESVAILKRMFDGNKVRVRLLRFFVLNPQKNQFSEIVNKNILPGVGVRRELNLFEKIS